MEIGTLNTVEKPEVAAQVEAPANESLASHLEKTVEGFKTGEGDIEPGEAAEVKPKIGEDGQPLEPTAEKDAADKKEKEDGEKADEAPKDEAKPDGEPEEGKPVPYDRFKEVVEAKTSFKRQLEEVQPVVDNYNRITNFCQTNSITPEQFEKAMRVQALLNTNPAEALKEILPLVETLQGYVGNKLPADLQAKVDAGKLDLEDARELASSRAQKIQAEQMVKRTQEQVQRDNAMRFQAECQREAQTWEKTKRSSDPDYLPKKSDGEPDGKWEDVRDKYMALINQLDARGNYVNPVKTSTEMVALMEKAYSLVNTKYTHLNGRKQVTRKPLSSNGSPGSHEKATIEGAGSMREAIAVALAQRAK